MALPAGTWSSVILKPPGVADSGVVPGHPHQTFPLCLTSCLTLPGGLRTLILVPSGMWRGKQNSLVLTETLRRNTSYAGSMT